MPGSRKARRSWLEPWRTGPRDARVLVVAAVELQDGSGAALAGEIAARGMMIPVVLMAEPPTALVLASLRGVPLVRGVLRKPLRLDELRSALRVLLAGPRSAS